MHKVFLCFWDTDHANNIQQQHEGRRHQEKKYSRKEKKKNW